MTMINRVLNRIPEENSDLPAGMNKAPTGPGMSTDIGQNFRNTHIGCCS